MSKRCQKNRTDVFENGVTVRCSCSFVLGTSMSLTLAPLLNVRKVNGRYSVVPVAEVTVVEGSAKRTIGSPGATPVWVPVLSNASRLKTPLAENLPSGLYAIDALYPMRL